MLRQALALWKQEKHKKGTSLQYRLILFFVAITSFIILSFTALLLIFDITGSGRDKIYSYMDNELTHLKTEITEDYSRLSLQAVAFAENLVKQAELFFQEQAISAVQLHTHSELIEPLLNRQMPDVLNVIEQNTCGGAFIILDASIQSQTRQAPFAKSGVFIKKTQPSSLQRINAKKYYLRGPAQIARNNGIELLGQWKMEYDVREEDFFTSVIEMARQNPDKPLSRLYYWTERTTLAGNSEAGFLLCVPLRSMDGTVFGVCGIEVSDRMVKQLYSPNASDYIDVFTLVAPVEKKIVHAEKGLLAGNYYLTGNHIMDNLSISEEDNDFYTFQSPQADFGGLHTDLRLYPSGSIYEREDWSISILMPRYLLYKAIAGNTVYLLTIVILLLIISLGASVFISRRYLRPVTEALDTIKNKRYSTTASNKYLEINDLMEFLAKQDEKIESMQADNLAGEQISSAKAEPSNINITPMFKAFLENIDTLSQAERSVFNLYIQGYKAKEIAELLCLSINTIKTHNRRIFTKLNVSSRNELLVYIHMMKEMKIIDEV